VHRFQTIVGPPLNLREETAAIVGPSIGPCCYAVGAEVSGRFEADLTRDGMLVANDVMVAFV
jgi:copper oxidase (laccase) domain-containing protein